MFPLVFLVEKTEWFFKGILEIGEIVRYDVPPYNPLLSQDNPLSGRRVNIS
jgi:hypothetical protein